MRRYVPRPPRAWRDSDFAWEPGSGEPCSMTVHSDEPDTFSGLYDADGNELHRPRDRTGFRLAGE